MDRRRRRISALLVEDEEIHRVVARAVLRAAGFELDAPRRCGVCGSASAAAAAAAPTTSSSGVRDKQMPVMDGHEATRQIQAMGVATPIVAVSSTPATSTRRIVP